MAEPRRFAPGWRPGRRSLACLVVAVTLFSCSRKAPVVTLQAAPVEPVVKPAIVPVRPAPELEKPKELETNKKLLDVEKKTEDPVHRKTAESDHNESADNEEVVPDKGVYDSLGTGGGSGGRYGGRLGGRQSSVARGGGGRDTEDAVLSALKWLSRHQNEDGSWSAVDHTRRCNRIARYSDGGKCAPSPGQQDHDAGVTGLAMLAFLGNGYSHLSKDMYDGIVFGTVAKKGLQWLLAHQDPEGCIGPRTASKYTYNHAICAMALAEAYGLTGSNLFKDQAQKGIDFLVKAQNPEKGWRYTARSGDSDTSVTGWAMMALRSAEISGLVVPRSSLAGGVAWLDSVTEENYYRVGYTHKGTGKVYVPGLNESFEHHEALTAIAVTTRFFTDKNKSDPRLLGGCRLLMNDLPAWKDDLIDFYYWHWATLALFRFDGPGGPYWKQWNEKMKDALVTNQNTASTGCKAGSWETVDRWSCEGGRVYATAINALTLETYYR